MRRSLLTITILLLLAPALVTAQKKYEASWESLDTHKIPEWYSDAKFGIFIHWGVYSVPSFAPKDMYSEWYWHALDGDPAQMNKRQQARHKSTNDFHNRVYGKDFTYEDFAPMFQAEFFDAEEWADIFKKSGARYIVPTSKHHDGFALWPSKEANKVWGRAWNSVDAGPRRDLLGELTNAVREQGMKMGFYYSLYEWFNPLWLKDQKRYAVEHMHPQFKDVVNRYKPAIIFSDGEWDLPAEDWKSPELLAWLFNESAVKEDVVINDRWGKGIRHTHGDYYTTEYGAGMPDASHPWEENRGMGHSFGYNRYEAYVDYKTSRELIIVLADLTSRGGNFLLDIGPDSDGRIPELQQERLLDIGKWLDVNGEAIYGSRTWKNTCQWSTGTPFEQGYENYKQKYNVLEQIGMEPVDGKARKQAFFTRKDNTLYAIVPQWPGEELALKDVASSGNTRVTMLGVPGTLQWKQDGDDIRVTVPQLTVDKLPCEVAWTFKVTNVK
jgi:alpha-L-fucosidase